MPDEPRPARESGTGDRTGPDKPAEQAGPLPSGPATAPPSAGESPREAVHRRMRELAQSRERDEARPGSGDAGAPPPDQDPPA